MANYRLKVTNSCNSIFLCPVSEITEQGSKEFDLGNKKVFVIASDSNLYGYSNNCPHANWPLNFQPDVFLNFEKTYIQCSNHMALFEKATGKCISGPCTGDALEKIDINIIDGGIYTANQAREE